MNVFTQHIGSRPSLLRIPAKQNWLRMRFQLVGGLMVAVLLPALLRMASSPSQMTSDALQVTIIAGAVAHVLGFMIHRRIAEFPGVAPAAYILPTFLLTYGLVFFAILFFRLDYSRLQAAGSMVLSTLWYFTFAVASKWLVPYNLAWIPGCDIRRLKAIPGVNWWELASPTTNTDHCSGVVVDLRGNLSQDWQRYIADSALSGVPVYHVKQVAESLTGRVDIESLSENTLGSLNPNHIYISVKQWVDWIFALLCVVLLSPLLIGIAIAIRMETPGPALFRQERRGYRGRSFMIYKFRSMQIDTGGHDARQRAQTQTADTRVTRVGRFLRVTRLDELPQAFNILRGEMSWIGPRPEARVLSEWYEAELPFYRYRHIVRPGISGWAQVNQGHVVQINETQEKLHYDFYYIKNFSPWLDVLIVLRTIRTLITGFGAR